MHGVLFLSLSSVSLIRSFKEVQHYWFFNAKNGCLAVQLRTKQALLAQIRQEKKLCFGWFSNLIFKWSTDGRFCAPVQDVHAPDVRPGHEPRNQQVHRQRERQKTKKRGHEWRPPPTRPRCLPRHREVQQMKPIRNFLPTLCNSCRVAFPQFNVTYLLQ